MSIRPTITVIAATASQQPAAQALAERLSLPFEGCASALDSRSRKADRVSSRWILERADSGLSLRRPDGARVAADFARGRGAAHAREADLASQPLARALGIAALAARLARHVTLLDMTAGLGVDAWIAATLGARVTMLERSPVVHALLEDALRRARADTQPRIRHVADRLTLIQADAGRYTCSASDGPDNDLVYLDPMYPERRVRGGQRKGIEALQSIVDDSNGGGSQEKDLLDAALRLAGARVVVKRPKGATPLSCVSGRRPDDAIEGPRTRYDRYRIDPRETAAAR